jgi:branched-chain amino acid transport system permease protein
MKDSSYKSQQGKKGYFLFFGLVFCIAVSSFFLGSYELSVIAKMMIYSIFAISLNLLVGYTGIASLGHAAFFGVGGYAIALLSNAGVGGFLLPLAAAIASSLLVGMMFGALTLRAHGAYQLMITLALAQVLWGAAYGWRRVTGGDDGIPGIAMPVSIPGIDGSVLFFWIILILFAGVAVVSNLFPYSPFGRSLVGIRENPNRMMALGYNVWLNKFIVFMISAVIAGLAGALLAWHNGFVGPSYLSVTCSALVLIMVIVGGSGTVVGPILGAFLIVGFESVIGNLTERWVLVLGLIYILTSLFAPHGIVGLMRAGVREQQ